MRRREILIVEYRRISIAEYLVPVNEEHIAGSEPNSTAELSQQQKLPKTAQRRRASWVRKLIETLNGIQPFSRK